MRSSFSCQGDKICYSTTAMDDVARPVSTQSPKHRRIGLYYIIPIGLLLGFLLFAANFYLKQNGFTLPELPTLDQLNTQPTPTAQVMPTTTPTPTAEPFKDEDKKTVRISVLNGSGVAGAAGDAATVLKDAGFTTVTTGNAESYDQVGLSIQYRAGEKGAADAVRQALSANYTVESIEEEDVSANADVVVIIGRDRDEKETEAEE